VIKQTFEKSRIDFIDIVIFLIPVVLFGFTWFVYFPGVLTFDSYNQLNQIATGEFVQGHPLIHTLIELLLLKIWNNPGVIGLFQILVFSTIWTVICKYNRAKVLKKGFVIIQILFTIFICLNPLNSIHAITLWKDILYSYMILLLSFMFLVILDRKFVLQRKEIIGLIFLLVLIPNLRYNGLIVFIFSTLILILLLFLKDRRSKNWLIMIVFTGITFFLFQIPTKILVQPTGPLFGVFSLKTVHLTGDYLYKGLFSSEEENFIASFINTDSLRQKYNPYFLDPIGSVEINEELYAKNRREFNMLLIRKSVKNPIQFLDYLGKSTVVIWKIKIPEDSIGTTLTTGYDAVNNIDNIQQIHSSSRVFSIYNKYIEKTLSNDILKIIFYSPAFYFYLSIILILIVVVRKGGDFSYMLILLPNSLNLLGLMISIPVQDVRYVYSSILTGYLAILLLFREGLYNQKIATKKGTS